MVYDLNVLVGVGDRPHSEGIVQGTEVKGGVNWRREVRQASRGPHGLFSPSTSSTLTLYNVYIYMYSDSMLMDYIQCVRN